MSPDRRPKNPTINQERQEATQQFLERNQINPKTFSFLQDCVAHGAYEGLDARRRNLIGMYYSTPVHLPELKTLAGVTTYHGVRRAILTGMNQMRQNLPPELQDQYQPDETFLFKRKITPESRNKISEKLKQAWRDPERHTRISNASKAHKHSVETRARISQVQIGKKHTIPARTNMSEAQLERRAKEKAQRLHING